MRVIISEIPEEGMELELTENIHSGPVRVLTPVCARLKIDKKLSEVYVRGSIEGGVELQCGRCLKLFAENIKTRMEVVYHPADILNVDERYELKSDELDMGFYRNDTLETMDLLTEQLLLSVPMKPLCSPGCKGICPKCGADLNTDNCNCESGEIDPRLKALEQLLKRKE